MFTRKKELEQKQETQRQVTLYILKLITIILAELKITPQKLTELLNWKEVESAKYLNELLGILQNQGSQDTFKTATGLDQKDFETRLDR